jgi:hypothetical protein
MVLATLLLVGATTPLAAQDWATAQYSRQIGTTEEAAVTIQYSAGHLMLSGMDSNQLYAMRLRYNAESHEPVHQFGSGRVVLGIEGTGRASFLRSGSNDGEMALTLSDRIPIALSLDLGAVRATLDLGGLRLTRLDLNAGASEGELRVSSPNPMQLDRATLRTGAASFRAREMGNLNAAEISLEAGVGDFLLDLTGLRRPETTVDVKMGLGSLEVRVPRQVGIRLSRRSFLASLNAPGLERRGDDLYSSNWDQAPIRVLLSVEAALGSITITRFDP